jgi:hypothetical protein
MLTRLSLRALRAQAPSAASAQRFVTQTSTPLTPHISRATRRTSQLSSVISNHPPRRPTQAYYRIPRSSSYRAFTSTPHPKAQYNRYNRSNQYNRFNPRGSLIYSLIQNSKPHHYVIIGIGISGIYLYNTDVVSVSLRSPPISESCKDRRTHTESKTGDWPPPLHLRVTCSGT